jgi:hypothetical protein
MAGTTNMVIAELTRYASLIAGIVRDSRKPGAGVRRNVFVATMQQLESDLDDLRRTADLGDAAHSVMETASALNHAQANPESMATFLRPAQVSIATAIKQYRRQHSAGQSLKSTAIKTSQHVTLPDGKRAVVTGVALGSDGEPLVRVKAVKAIDWRSTLLALQPIVQGAIAAAQRGVFTSKEERIFTRASAMLKRASVGVGAGIPKEAANFARTAQQASDSAKRYGQLASLPDDQHKPGEKEAWLRTYAHTASAVMTYLKEAINAIPATRTVTKSADVNGGRYVLKNFIPQLKRIAFSGHNKLLKSPQNQHLAEQVQGELKNIINLISQVRGFIELDLAAYRQLRAEVSEFMNTQDFAESAQYVGRYVQKLEKDLKQALTHSAKSADVIVLAARDVTPVKARYYNDAWGREIMSTIDRKLGSLDFVWDNSDGTFTVGYLYMNPGEIGLKPAQQQQAGLARRVQQAFPGARMRYDKIITPVPESVGYYRIQVRFAPKPPASKSATKAPTTRVNGVTVKNELGFIPHPEKSGDYFFFIDHVEHRIYGTYKEALQKAVNIARRDSVDEIEVTGLRPDYGQ